jgi:pimeloyl-ACP methyl ester carboxylesterase
MRAVVVAAALSRAAYNSSGPRKNRRSSAMACRAIVVGHCSFAVAREPSSQAARYNCFERKVMTEPSISRRSMIGGVAAGISLAAAAPSGDIVDVARAQSSPKTFLLVHGTYCGGWIWRRVSNLLEKKGHRVYSPTLTGLGERSHLLSREINLDTQITDIVNVVKWEDLSNICLVAHSYGGWPASGALEQIGGHVSSIVWLDAYKPEDGQRPIDLTSEFLRRVAQNSLDKGEPGFPTLRAELFLVNENDRTYVDSKLTPHPVGTYFQPIRLPGARDKVAKKTYIRVTRYQNPAFSKALAECKADTSWSTVENTTSGHAVMIDEPEWLADTLIKTA